MFDQPPRSYTFILRFREERSPGSDAPVWRFMLEDTRQHSRHGFASLDALVTFLQKCCGDLPGQSAENQRSGNASATLAP